MLCVPVTDLPDEAQAETSRGEFPPLNEAAGFDHEFIIPMFTSPQPPHIGLKGAARIVICTQ